MEYHKYSAVPIISRTGRYVGTLTEGDLLWGIKNQFNLDLKGAEKIPVTAVRRRVDNRPVTAGEDNGRPDYEGDEIKILYQCWMIKKSFIGINYQKKILSKYFYQKYRSFQEEEAREEKRRDEKGQQAVRISAVIRGEESLAL